MSKYDSKKFIDALSQKVSQNKLICPYCNGTQFTTPDEFASILMSKEMSSINIGPTIPAGMVVCQNCGHIDFFALGALNLLEKKEEKQNNG